MGQVSVAEFLAEYREMRAKDIAETGLNTPAGWNVSRHRRIVFRCPSCKSKIGADVDTSEGPQDEMYHECEVCGVEIRLALEWRVEPDLIGVQFFVANASPAE